MSATGDGENGIHIELAAHGLMESLETQSLSQIQKSLGELTDRQTDLADSISFENDKLRGAQQSVGLPEMIAKTQHYQNKMSALVREMAAISERSNQMKQRAFR